MGAVFILLAIATDPVRLVPMALLGWIKGHAGIKWWLAMALAAFVLAAVTGMIVHGSRVTVVWLIAAFLLGLLDAALAALLRKLIKGRKGRVA